MHVTSSNHGMEASTVVMRSDKNVVGPPSPIPKRVMSRNKVNSRRNERTSVTNSREAIDGTEITRHINRDEEKIGFIRVKSPYIAIQKRFMNRNLRSEQMVATTLV